MTYEEQITHPQWQKRKSQILERDKYTCRSCGRSDITLHVHHLFYVPGTTVWDYRDDDLITYCEICHNTQHLIGNTLQECLIEVIKENPLLIHIVAQLCVLVDKVDDFENSLRSFLKTEMGKFYESKKQ